MTGKAEQGRAAAFEQALDRALDRHLPAALDRHLPRFADPLADAVVDRLLDRLGDRPPVKRRGHDRLDQRYPARDAAAWIDTRFDRKACPANTRSTLWRWREGHTAWAWRSTLEEMVVTFGGDPADLPDELPAVDAVERVGDRG